LQNEFDIKEERSKDLDGRLQEEEKNASELLNR
jgi:hypothetical protein